jgi:hypothetical protein
VKERGILFSAPMVRALLAGTKTQTRRIVKLPRGGEVDGFAPDEFAVCWSRQHQPTGDELLCSPYGIPGDRLWVRETWQAIHVYIDPETGHGDDVEAAPSIPKAPGTWWSVVYAAADPQAAYHRDDRGFGWRPGIHMPRWASRITLEVTSVRVERVQDISEADARAEGVRPFFEAYEHIGRDQRICTGEYARDAPYRASYACLWDEINGDRALWSSNPWVWVVEFQVQPR